MKLSHKDLSKFVKEIRKICKLYGVKYGCIRFNVSNELMAKYESHGFYGVDSKNIFIGHNEDVCFQMSILLHELGHAFYYSLYDLKPDQVLKIYANKMNGHNICDTHLERMADVLGWQLLLRLKGYSELKKYYQVYIRGMFLLYKNRKATK